MFRFVVLFLICLIALFTLELLQPVQTHVILPFTAGVAHVSVWVMHLFDQDVIARQNDILNAATGGGIEIVAGCNGIEAVLILVSAVLAFPAPWKHKLMGLAAGIVAVQGLNILRVISLFYLGQWDYKVFEWAHLYVWQALIMLDVLVVWLIWVRTLPGARDDRAPPSPPAAATASA